MTLLKKIGGWLATGVKYVALFEGLLTTAAPGSTTVAQTVSKDLTELLNLVVSIEGVGQSVTPQMTGAQKAAAIAPQVMQVVIQSAALANKPIANPAEVLAGSQDLAAALGRILNGFHENGADQMASDIKSS